MQKTLKTLVRISQRTWDFTKCHFSECTRSTKPLSSTQNCTQAPSSKHWTLLSISTNQSLKLSSTQSCHPPICHLGGQKEKCPSFLLWLPRKGKEGREGISVKPAEERLPRKPPPVHGQHSCGQASPLFEQPSLAISDFSLNYVINNTQEHDAPNTWLVAVDSPTALESRPVFQSKLTSYFPKNYGSGTSAETLIKHWWSFLLILCCKASPMHPVIGNKGTALVKLWKQKLSPLAAWQPVKITYLTSSRNHKMKDSNTKPRDDHRTTSFLTKKWMNLLGKQEKTAKLSKRDSLTLFGQKLIATGLTFWN